MPDYRLRIGMRFRQQAREYVIEQGLPDNHLKVRDVLSSESSVKTRRELITALLRTIQRLSQARR
jgi:hypothetical protein